MTWHCNFRGLEWQGEDATALRAAMIRYEEEHFPDSRARSFVLAWKEPDTQLWIVAKISNDQVVLWNATRAEAHERLGDEPLYAMLQEGFLAHRDVDSFDVQTSMGGWHTVTSIKGARALADALTTADQKQREGRLYERFRVVANSQVREVIYETFSPWQLLAQGWHGEDISAVR